MRIFFTTPRSGRETHKQFIEAIIDTIETSGSSIVSPEKTEQYHRAMTLDKIEEFNGPEYAHYEFIRQGIASADAVVIEASTESFRIGHEATLALMYGKPVLVLAEHRDYSKYINNERFFGKQYTSLEEVRAEVSGFISFVTERLGDQPYQTIGEEVDLQHSAALSRLRLRALQGKSYFADWARRSGDEPDQVKQEILAKLGDLPVQQPWDVFSKIYNEDTPDSVFFGAVKFVDRIFRDNGVGHADQIIDVACGTGAISRTATSFGYRNIIAFDRSRAMLAEAFRLSSHLPSIKIMESDIANFRSPQSAKAMAWLDFSSNIALDETEFTKWLTNLVENLSRDGVLVFDLRTLTGWNVDFFQRPVTAYETDRFQRIRIKTANHDTHLFNFDVFIRTRDMNAEWQLWEREQLTVRMWTLAEVLRLVRGLPNIDLVGVYKDDFGSWREGEQEPGLAYIAIKKR